jgi:hypothetical protein
MVKRFLGLLVLLSCTPVDSTDGTDGGPYTDPDGGVSGRLYDVPLRLTWAWTATEGDGVCMDLKVATNGTDVREWRLLIEADVEVSEIYYVEGADVRWVDGQLSVAPSISPELASGEEVLTKVCTRPGVRLTAMDAEVTYVDAPDTDVPDQPKPYDVLLDPGLEFALQYTEDGMGVENGGRCLRFDVINLTSIPVVDWALDVTMSAAVGRTASEGLWFYEGASADKVVVLPDEDSRTLQPFDAESGVLCLSPFGVPIAIRGGDAPDP